MNRYFKNKLSLFLVLSLVFWLASFCVCYAATTIIATNQTLGTPLIIAPGDTVIINNNVTYQVPSVNNRGVIKINNGTLKVLGTYLVGATGKTINLDSLVVSGNFNENSPLSSYGGRVVLDGVGAQLISPPSTSMYFYNLSVYNGVKTLIGSLIIGGELDLEAIIKTTNTDTLGLDSAAYISGITGFTNHYIQGPMYRRGRDGTGIDPVGMVFPVADASGTYRPVVLYSMPRYLLNTDKPIIKMEAKPSPPVGSVYAGGSLMSGMSWNMTLLGGKFGAGANVELIYNPADIGANPPGTLAVVQANPTNVFSSAGNTIATTQGIISYKKTQLTLGIPMTLAVGTGCTPVAAALNVSPNDTICTGASAIFSVTTSGAAIYDSVYYFVNSVLKLRALPGTSYTSAALANNDTVSALILNGLCVDTMNRIIMRVLNPVPSAGQDQTICAGKTATLAGSCLGGGTWKASSGNPPGGGTFSPNNTTLNATYTPSSVDITINSVTLTLTSKVCPASNDQMVITILPLPATPAVTVSNLTSSGMKFSWPAIAGATSYSISINGGVAINLGTALFYNLTGATPLTTYTASVTAIAGACPGLPGTAVGKTLGAAFAPCDTSWTVAGSPFCVASTRAILVPTVSGGIFSGTGVSLSGGNYYFDPSLSGAGTFSIKYKRPCGDSLVQSLVVDPAPCVTTIISGGPGGGSILVSNPQGIYTGCDGSIYYSSTDSNRIYKVDPFGVITLMAGPAGLSGPTALVVNPANGDIYFSDTKNNQIKKISGGVVTVIAGTGGPIGYLDNAVGASAKFNSPVGLVANPTFTKLYIADIGNRRIREIDLSGTYPVTTLAGTGATGSIDGPALSATFNNIQQLAVDNNFVYITDKGSRRIRKINLTTNQVTTIVKNTGVPTTGYADGPQGVYEVQTPVGISVDGSGIVYFTDLDNCSVRTFDTTSAIVTTIAGGPPPNPSCGFANGTGTTARFDQPTALSVFVKGFIDVADTKNNAIRRFAIQNWSNNPFIGFKTKYCSYDPKDTLVPQFTGGIYISSPVSRAVYQSGGRWFFNPDSAGPGTHRVGYRYTSGYCSDTLFQDVVVFPVVKPNLGPDQSVCQNSFGKFTLNGGLDGTKPYNSYAWTNLTTNLNPGSSRFYTIPAPGPAVGSSYTIKLIVVDTNGCVGGDTTKITSIVSYPISLGQDQSVCEGTIVSLTPAVVGVGVATSILWQDSSSVSPYVVSKGGVYSVRVKFANGCSGSDTVNISYKFPVPFTIVSSKPETCSRTITAFAGTGAPGAANGAKATASFNFPQNMVKDKAGNIYVTDFGNNKIRKITPAGVVSDYTGTGMAASTGTTLASATFNQPFGIAIDKNDNLYVTEQGSSNIIRKITPGGQVSIFAGVAMAGGWNGDGRKDTTRFWTPAGIVVDGAGNVYVADYGNNVVREISPLGLVKTLGLYTVAPADVNGNFSTAKYLQPQSLAIDYSGYIYVGNTNGQVRKIDPFLKTVKSYSGLGNLISVNGLAVDNNRNLYAGEKNNFTINYINPKDSTNITYAGQAGVPGPTNGVTPGIAQLDNPNGLFLDGPAGAPLYVLDKHSIRMVADSCVVAICPGSPTTLTVASGLSNYKWYKWNPAPTPPTVLSSTTFSQSVSASGKYFATATGLNNCTVVDTITVISIPIPIANAGPDIIACGSVTNQMIGTPSIAGNTYSWNTIPPAGVPFSNTAQTPVTTNVTKAYVVTVTNTASNCANKDTVNIKINPLPNMSLGLDDSVCTSSNPGIDSMMIGPASNGYLYQWSSSPAPSINNTTTPIYVFTPIVNTSYYLMATDVVTGCVKKDTINYKVNPLPTGTAGTPYTFKCRGDILPLGGPGNYNLYSYKWLPFSTTVPLGTYDNDTLSNPNYTLLDEFGNQFPVEIKNRITGCSVILYNGVLVNPSPEAGFTHTDVCFPNFTSFADTSTLVGFNPTGDSIMVNWNFGDPLVPATNTSTLGNPIHTFSAPGIYNVKLVTLTKSGCRDSITKQININGLTVAYTAPSTVCSGKPVTFSNSSVSNPVGAIVSTWDFGDGSPTVNTVSPVHTFPVTTTVPVSYNVKLKVTSASGCSDSLTKAVTVYPIPDATITSVPGAASVCAGTTVNLNVAAAYAGAPYQVIWRELNSNTVLSPASQVTLPVTTSGKYRATVTDTVGGCADSSFVTLNFLALPAALTMIAPSSSCSNAPLKLISTVTAGDSLQYTWTSSNGTGTFSNASNDTTFYTPAPTDTSPLTFQIKASNRCKADSVNQPVNLLASAIASFTYLPAEPFMNDLITFMPDTGTGGSNIVKWLWNFKEGNALDSVNYIGTHTYLNAGSFPVTLTLTNNVGCPTVVTNYVNISGPVIYIPNVFEPSTVNPENSVCKVYGTSIAPEEFSFRIYDKWGSVVYQTLDFIQANQIGWNGKNMSGGDPLPMGVYTWAVKGHFYDGSNFQKAGTVTLVR